MKNTPYLIQRAAFALEHRDYSSEKGIDLLLTFHYMGSAEFEFGALPKSLSRVRADKNGYAEPFTVTVEGYPGSPFTVLCKKNDSVFIPQIINGLSSGSIRTKERTDITTYLAGKDKGNFMNTDFWWDIENDYFFWKSDERFTKRFMELIFVSTNG